jgi:hypothetical protein
MLAKMYSRGFNRWVWMNCSRDVVATVFYSTARHGSALAAVMIRMTGRSVKNISFIGLGRMYFRVYAGESGD